MKLDWRQILAVGGVIFGGVVLYRIMQLQVPTVKDAGTVVGDTAAEIIKLPYTIATSLGAGKLGSAIGTSLAPDTPDTGLVSFDMIAWKSGMRTWLRGQGATDAEALEVIGAWQPGMDAPTMDNVQRLRDGLTPFSFWQELKAN